MGFRELDGDDVRPRGARRRPRLGRRRASAGCCTPAPRPRSALARPCGSPRPTNPRRRRRSPRAAARGRRAQELNPRLTFDQFVIGDEQPARARGRPRRRRDARAGLQPALHLRPARPGQDPPVALDRQLRHTSTAAARPPATRPPRPSPTTSSPRSRAATWTRSRRPTAASTSCSSTTCSSSPEGQDRAGVLPHLQRAAPGRRAARADVRPPPAGHGRARGPAARALRGRPGVRRARRRPRHAPDDPAQARAPGRRR